MKRFIIIAFALLACSFAASAQYARSLEECNDAVYRSFNTAVSFSTADEAVQSPDYVKALKDKKTGTALLVTAGACTAVGATFFGLTWTLISDSVGDFARWAVPVTGITLLSASVPMYIAGSVLYVRGKNATMELAPGALAIKF